jgi:hypothetical protein
MERNLGQDIYDNGTYLDHTFTDKEAESLPKLKKGSRWLEVTSCRRHAPGTRVFMKISKNSFKTRRFEWWEFVLFFFLVAIVALVVYVKFIL